MSFMGKVAQRLWIFHKKSVKKGRLSFAFFFDKMTNVERKVNIGTIGNYALWQEQHELFWKECIFYAEK